jgi:protein phosphatase
MYVSAILIAILLAGGYALYAWLRQYRRAQEHERIPGPPAGRSLGSERERAVKPIELTAPIELQGGRRKGTEPIGSMASSAVAPRTSSPAEMRSQRAHAATVPDGSPMLASAAPAGHAAQPVQASVPIMAAPQAQVPVMAAPRLLSGREGGAAAIEHAPAHRRVRRRDPTMQISAAELAQITIDDEGTTLAAEALRGARDGRRRVSVTTEVDLAAELPIAVEEDDASGPYFPVSVVAAGATHVGKKRKHNEDAIAMLESHNVYVLADGMGGYAAGEVASQMCVDSILQAYRTGQFGGEPIEGLPPRGDELVRAIQTANAEILHESRTNEARAGMGTTVVATRFVPARQRLYIAHVGDSRLYRMRKDELVQLTTDHTLGAQGVTGPAAQKLSRAVGVFDEVEVDLNIDVPEVGDVYLICSDGLVKMVHELRIVEILAEQLDPQRAADILVEEANARGGKDNISVLVIRVGEIDLRRMN